MIIHSKEENTLIDSIKYLEAILNDPDMKFIIPKSRRIVNDSNMEWLEERCRFPFRHEPYIDSDTRYEIREQIKIIKSIQNK